MGDNDILLILKAGLQITGSYTDQVLLQKGKAVEAYLLNAGILAENIESSLGKAVLCIGVTDLWNLGSGEIQFSPAFHALIEQLYVKGLV
jgi:hypothetical protein